MCKSAVRSAATYPSHLVDGGLRIAAGGVAGGDRLVEVRLLGLQRDRKGNQEPKGNRRKAKRRSAPAAEAAMATSPWRRARSLNLSSLYSALMHQQWCDRSMADDLGLLVACQEFVKRWHLGAGDALQVAEADVVLQGGDVKAVEGCARHGVLYLQGTCRVLLAGNQQRTTTSCHLHDCRWLQGVWWSRQGGVRGTPQPSDWHICKAGCYPKP